MKKYLQHLIISAGLLLGGVFVLAPAPAGALFEESIEQACKGAALDSSVGGSECKDNSRDAQTKVESTIQTIIDLLTVIVGIISVIMIIINGLRFITANGDSNSISSARTGIIYAIVGLVIVAFAQVIVRFVLERTG